MIITNRLDKTFGPQLAFSGWIFLAVGLLFILDIMGMVLLILGFFLATSTDGVLIDLSRRRVKRFSGPLGYPLFGRWENLDNYAGLTALPMTRKFVSWSRSNRQNVSETSDIRIFLVGKDRKPAFPVKKCDSMEVAVKEMDKLAEALSWMVWKADLRGDIH
ncbi:MAG: hypothetical protein ACOZDD_07660 [Bacteroidota bacterium]